MKYLDSAGLSYLWSKIKAKFVPQTRTINGKALSANISLSASDVGASSSSHTHKYAGSSSAGGAATSALTCTGNSATATKATQDGNGNNIVNTYCTKAELEQAVSQLQATINALNLGFCKDINDMYPTNNQNT